VMLWHTLRREATGAWRSVRYDLDSHRAAKLAGAFTEELEPSGDPDRSRLLPLTGVALLLAGGAAGAFLAISGGLAALSADQAPLAIDRPAAASAAPLDDPVVAASSGHRAGTPRRPGGRQVSASPAGPPGLAGPAGPPAAVAGPAGPAPVLEGSALPPSPSPSSSAHPSPSIDPSESPSATAGAGSYAPGPGR